MKRWLEHRAILALRTGAGSLWRRQGWGVVIYLLAAALFTKFFLEQRAQVMPGKSDPFYIWLWARSLVFDGDFEFTNDYALCGDPFQQSQYAVTDHPPNPYYLGPTVFYAPALWLVRAFSTFAEGAPTTVTQGCTGVLVYRSMVVGPLLGALALFLSYRVARRWADDGPAALATALFGLAGVLTGYAAYQPGYSHVFATFSIALLAWLALRAWENPRSMLRWLLAGLALALAVWQRPPQLLYGLLPAVLAWLALRGRQRIGAIGLLTLGGALGVVPLLMLYRYMYGSYFGSPIGADYLHPAHAHPLLLLFAPHGGLFYTTPVAWLAVAGIWPALRRAEVARVVVPLMIVGAVEGLLYSSGLDWHGSGTFSARRLTSLTPLMIFLTAVLCQNLKRLLKARPERATTALGILLVTPLAFVTFGMLLGYSQYKIPCCSGSSQANLYGEGTKQAWALLDRNVGDVAVLPAAWAFAAWYDIPTVRFRDATQSKFYIRDFRTGRFVARRVVLKDPAAVTRGFADADPEALVASPAFVVFAPEWPYATHVNLTVSSEQATTLRIGRYRRFRSPIWYGRLQLHGKGRPTIAKLPIPAGGFDSGPLRLIIESDEPAQRGVRILNLGFVDERPLSAQH